MTVEAKGRDGAGWYILENDDGRRYLRHWVRYNIKQAAISEARRLFRTENCDVGFWTGAEWDRSTFEAVNPRQPPNQ